MMHSEKNWKKSSRADELRSEPSSTITVFRKLSMAAPRMLHIKGSSLKLLSAGLFALALLLVASCKREERGFRVQPPSANRINTKRISDLQPGAPAPHVPVKNEYEENGPAMSDGKRL